MNTTAHTTAAPSLDAQIAADNAARVAADIAAIEMHRAIRTAYAPATHVAVNPPAAALAHIPPAAAGRRATPTRFASHRAAVVASAAAIGAQVAAIAAAVIAL